MKKSTDTSTLIMTHVRWVNHLSQAIKFCVLVLLVLVSAQATAQTVANSNLNCTPAQAHCTSGDLSIVGVFVDAPACATCNSGQNVAYTLKMTIKNGTKSVRTAFALYGTLSAGATITPVGGGTPISGNVFICVGPVTVKSNETLPGESAPGNQTFTVGTISFSCGQSLTLSNNILAWTDASGTTPERCTVFGAATQCSDVEPKCGEAGTINIRQPLSAGGGTTASCSDSPTGSATVTPVGGATPYDIVIDGTAYNNVTTATKSSLAVGTYNFRVTDDAGCTSSGTRTVSSMSCCTPPTQGTNPSGAAACPGSSASFTASATGGSPTPTIQWQEKVGAGNFINITNGGVYSGATTGTLSISDNTGKNGNQYRAVFTSGSCTPVNSNPATLTVNTVPSSPSVTYVPPTCLETTFKVEVNSPVSGSTYTLRQLSGGVGPLTKTAPGDVVGGKIVFSDLTVGKGYRVTETSSGGCISSPASCGDFSGVTGARMNPQSTANEETQTAMVKAYPNPFSDKIKFVITSPVSGVGSLDVYNMMGQRVKTVYNGFIAEGTQVFELSLSTRQVANLVYVLRIGDKKMTGKILQINQ